MSGHVPDQRCVPRLISCLLLCSAVLVAWPQPVFAGGMRKGVLILAHGGTEQWNASIRDIVAQAELPYPTDIAFGMGMSAQEAAQIQEAQRTAVFMGRRRNPTFARSA